MHSPDQFPMRLAGVILPKAPPSFAVPYFKRFNNTNILGEVSEPAFLQEVSNERLATLTAEFILPENAITVPIALVRYVEYEAEKLTVSNVDAMAVAHGDQRLHAFAQSAEIAFIGYGEAIRHWLRSSWQLSHSDWVLTKHPFTALEVATYLRDSAMCLLALEYCFDALQQHNRTLAVMWLSMKKSALREAGILDSRDVAGSS